MSRDINFEIATLSEEWYKEIQSFIGERNDALTHLRISEACQAYFHKVQLIFPEFRFNSNKIGVSRIYAMSDSIDLNPYTISLLHTLQTDFLREHDKFEVKSPRLKQFNKVVYR
jgi:hypothetical protein